jgi:pilus assembly protein CpaF
MDQATLLKFFPERLRELLGSDEITDVMVNEDGALSVDAGGHLTVLPERLDSSVLVMGIQNIARGLGFEFDAMAPMLDTRLPDGSRVAALFRNGSVTLTIRKFNRWFTMAELVESHCVPPMVRDAIVEGIQGTGPRGKANILISGGTSSGKTTFAKAAIDFIPQQERLIVIENPSELCISHPNAPRWEARAAVPDGPAALSVADLLAGALRHRPDRIILGEVRKPAEAYELLQTLNTGHSGSISTIHADSSEDAFYRLSDLLLASHSNLSREYVNRQILRSIDFIVHLQRVNGVRQVTELSVADKAKECFSLIYSA